MLTRLRTPFGLSRADADAWVLEREPALGIVRLRVAEGEDECVVAKFFRPLKVKTNVKQVFADTKNTYGGNK